jgi:hypothetical protein
MGVLLFVLVALGAAAANAASVPEASAILACNEQKPLPFLIRGNYAFTDKMPIEERRARADLQARALRFRTEHYGRYLSFGLVEWNPRTVPTYAQATTFMGLPIEVNGQIVPALRCVEQAITASCGQSPYAPGRLLGYRSNNTFHNGEVSNHVYGIAIDIDPERNPCCRCVEPFPDHPACKRQGASIYERMALPKCWIDTFERYGFYWLGHDKLEDTMHFEFLGDPDKILAQP